MTAPSEKIQAYKALRKATESLHSHLYRQNNGVRLSPSQFAVLEVLYRNGPLSQRELAEAALRSSGNMTVVVDNLEKRGLVGRCSVEGDRRIVQVCLTTEGNALIQTLLPDHEGRLDSVFASLSETEIDQLQALCARITDHINDTKRNDTHP